MYDSHKRLNQFYEEHVRLGTDGRTLLAEYRDTNLDRLRTGLEELGYARSFEHRDQGSYAMYTINQQANNDYDIDVAIIFAKNNLPSSALQTRKRIENAMLEGGGNFRQPPEAKTNAVRVYYAEGYHVDLAVYREYEDDQGVRICEHAGSDWTNRDPMEITNWFNDTVRNCSPSKDYGATVSPNQMRRVVRWLKAFARSREYWDLPGGLVISVLVTECYQANYYRDDVSLYETMVAIRDRLQVAKDVVNPVDRTQTLTGRPVDQGRITRFKEKLDSAIIHLGILHEATCTEEQALKAWNWLFQHPFWSVDGKVESLDNYGKRLAEAARTSSLFVAPAGIVSTVKPEGRSMRVLPQKFYGHSAITSQYNEPAIPIGLQIAKMRQDFPDLTFKRRGNRPSWRGTLRPSEASPEYTVKIVYPFANRYSRCPKVSIVFPGVHPKAPHRYCDDSLCLFYPPERNWAPNKYISETIVPWAALWLAFYEIWLDTDHWYGPEAPHKGRKR